MVITASCEQPSLKRQQQARIIKHQSTRDTFRNPFLSTPALNHLSHRELRLFRKYDPIIIIISNIKTRISKSGHGTNIHRERTSQASFIHYSDSSTFETLYGNCTDTRTEVIIDFFFIPTLPTYYPSIPNTQTSALASIRQTWEYPSAACQRGGGSSPPRLRLRHPSVIRKPPLRPHFSFPIFTVPRVSRP